MTRRTAILIGMAGTVLGGIVLDLLDLIAFKALAVSLWGSTQTAFTWLGGSAVMSRWTLGLLWLAAFIVLFVAGSLVFAWVRDRTVASEFSAFKYTHDSFHGLLWRWRWSSDGSIHTIVPFCPHCDMQIVPQHEGAYRAVAPLVFRCEDCDVKHYEVPNEVSWDEVVQDIQLRVQRNVRRMADEAARTPAENT